MPHPASRTNRKGETPDPAQVQRLLAILDEKHFECERHELPEILVSASTIRHARKLLRTML